MITLYHLDHSRSERVIWLMEELGLQYRLEYLNRHESGMAPASLKTVHPVGAAPVIRDGDTVLAESGAILEYIAHRHGGGRFSPPPSAPHYARYLYWMHAVEGSVAPPITTMLLLDLAGAGGDDNPIGAMMRARCAAMLAFVDAELAATPYAAGEDFTLADILLVYPFTTMRRFSQIDISPYSHIQAYLQNIAARPAYRKAMSIAGN